MATNWYVSASTGNDSTGDGKTVGTAYATIQKAHDQTNPGDTVYIYPGIYGGGTGSTDILHLSRSGSAGNVIVYTGIPGMALPVLAAPLACSNPVQYTPGVAYIRLQNLRMMGPNDKITLASAWLNASAQATNTSTMPYNIGATGTDGISAATVALTTNGSTASGNATLHFAATTGVVAGDVVFNVSSLTTVPTGTTVVSTTGTTVVMSANATGAGVASGASVKFIHPVHHLEFINLIVQDYPGGGISPELCDYITIRGCVVFNNSLYAPNATSAISLYLGVDIDTNTSTYKNIIEQNIVFANQNLIGFTFSSIPMTTNATTAAGNAVLHFATNPAASGVVAGLQVWDTTTGAAILAGSTVVSVGTGTATMSSPVPVGQTVGSGNVIWFVPMSDGEGITIDDFNCDQQSLGSYAGKTIIRNNLVFGNGGAGIQAFNSHNVDIEYNTCYRNVLTPQLATNGYSDIYYDGATSGVCANNIVSSTTSAACINPTAGTLTASFNMGFGGNGTGLPGSNNITGQDPLFVNAGTVLVETPAVPAYSTMFCIQPGSPAIDAGTTTVARTTDFFGNPGTYGLGPDMGAVESFASPFGANAIDTILDLIQVIFASGQPIDFVSSDHVRRLITTIAAGRTPWNK